MWPTSNLKINNNDGTKVKRIKNEITSLDVLAP